MSNVTDIDDKIINRANDEARPWEDIAAKCESVWWKAMDGIGNARPDDIPHATAYVDEMVEMIGQLIEIGRAYPTDDGVYLSVETVEDYGLLAHQSLDDMLAGGGEREVFGAESKKHPADFVLWKLAKPGEPAWPSPWGDGPTGLAQRVRRDEPRLLGEGFDLHAGGQDLRFPHHENERAQAVALGKRFANHWMHHGMVVDADRARRCPRASATTTTCSTCSSATTAGRTGWCCCRATTASPSRSAPACSTPRPRRSPVSMPSPPARPRGRRASRPTTTCSTASGRRWTTTSTRPRRWRCCSTRCGGPTPCSTPATTLRRRRSSLPSGRSASPSASSSGSAVDVPDEVAARAVALDEARAARDYAAADEIRAGLQAEGWIVETTAAGTLVRR